MTRLRLVIGLVATAGSLLAVAACSGSSTSTGTGGDGGASSSSSSSSSGASGSTGSSGSSGGIKECPSTESTCTEAEAKPYSDCIAAQCDTTFTQCYGAGYKSGTFGGPCGTYITCTQACGCDDDACRAKCTLDDACKNCVIPAVSTCASKCEAPACASGGSSGSSGSSGGATKSCADLKTCCDGLADEDKKTECNQVYDGVKGSEPSCNAVYASYCP